MSVDNDKERVIVTERNMRLHHERGEDTVELIRLGGGVHGSIQLDEATHLYIALRDFLNVMNDG